MTKEEKRKIRKLKRKAAKNRNRANRRKEKRLRIKARKSGKVGKIKARKSAKIERQKQKTARVDSRSGRKLARQTTKQDKIQAKFLSGAYTPEAIEARMSGYGDIAGGFAEGAVSGALGGGSVLDLLSGDKDEEGDIIAGSGSQNITKYILIGGAVIVGLVVLTSGRKAA
jgi:hypothetical protein